MRTTPIVTFLVKMARTIFPFPLFNRRMHVLTIFFCVGCIKFIDQATDFLSSSLAWWELTRFQPFYRQSNVVDFLQIIVDNYQEMEQRNCPDFLMLKTFTVGWLNVRYRGEYLPYFKLNFRPWIFHLCSSITNTWWREWKVNPWS